jgi:hypothetical protein
MSVPTESSSDSGKPGAKPRSPAVRAIDENSPATALTPIDSTTGPVRTASRVATSSNGCGCGGDHADAFGRRQAGALLQVRSKSTERHLVNHPRQRASVQRAEAFGVDRERHTLRPAVALRVAGDSDATEKSTLVRHSGIVSGSAASDNAATIAERCFRCSSDCCDDTATPDEVRVCLVPH